jgi:hypothetical protein
MPEERKKCKYPMSEFYIYEDEVPPNTRVSTPEDCEKCDGMGEDCCEDAKFCLITETPDEPKKCFNHCPKCDATDPDIEWGDKEWYDTGAYQLAECKKCGCEFKEYYEYSDTEIVEDSIPTPHPNPDE